MGQVTAGSRTNDDSQPLLSLVKELQLKISPHFTVAAHGLFGLTVAKHGADQEEWHSLCLHNRLRPGQGNIGSRPGGITLYDKPQLNEHLHTMNVP